MSLLSYLKRNTKKCKRGRKNLKYFLVGWASKMFQIGALIPSEETCQVS